MTAFKCCQGGCQYLWVITVCQKIYRLVYTTVQSCKKKFPKHMGQRSKKYWFSTPTSTLVLAWNASVNQTSFRVSTLPWIICQGVQEMKQFSRHGWRYLLRGAHIIIYLLKLFLSSSEGSFLWSDRKGKRLCRLRLICNLTTQQPPAAIMNT